MKRARKKSDADLAREWDGIAELRTKQIMEQTDISFHHVLLPYLLRTTSNLDVSSVLDVGCGTGFVSRKFSMFSAQVVGIDPSTRSIDIARSEATKHGLYTNLLFENASVEAYAATHQDSSFTLAVANMTLNAVNSLETALRAISLLLVPGGHLVFTTTHPCFWPFYWGYAEAPWFDYSKEIFIEAPFKISLENKILPHTTHVHRPLEQYTKALLSAGLQIDELVELKPTAAIEELYPRPWKYPRFIGASCTRERPLL